VEADLSRYHRLDLRDYWTRRTRRGRRVLTFRGLLARVKHLPTDSAVGRVELDGSLITTPELLVLMEIWEALTGKPHHLRPQPKPDPEVEAKKQRQLAEARERARVRRERIARGEI
jgi:hypothetical protein